MKVLKDVLNDEEILDRNELRVLETSEIESVSGGRRRNGRVVAICYSDEEEEVDTR